MQSRVLACAPKRNFLIFTLAALAAPFLGLGSTEAQEPAAVVEIDGKSYTFDHILCSLPENEGGELGISARQDGLQLDITRNEDVGSVVSLYDHENPMSPSVSWEAPDPAMMPSQRRALSLIQVDGSEVTVEATFHNEQTGTTAEGRVVARCETGGASPVGVYHGNRGWKGLGACWVDFGSMQSYGQSWITREKLPETVNCRSYSMKLFSDWCRA